MTPILSLPTHFSVGLFLCFYLCVVLCSASSSQHQKQLLLFRSNPNPTTVHQQQQQKRHLADTATGWKQLGSDMVGESASDLSGGAIAMNADATRIAIGAMKNRGGGVDAGQVRVYEWNAQSSNPGWVQMGPDIDGTAATGSGETVAMSGDGSILAIGAFEATPFVGSVRLYSYNPTNKRWTQLGAELKGTTSRDRFGMAVDLNYDGSIVAIASPYHDFTTVLEDKGRVQVYQYTSDPANANGAWNWFPLGDPILGQASGDMFGADVALNRAGDILAVGASKRDGGTTGSMVDAGAVTVYKKIPNNNVWQPLGQELPGVKTYDQSGLSVAINDDGTILAIGNPRHSQSSAYNEETGSVRVFAYSTINNRNRWEARGDTLYGAAPGDWFGSAIDLNADGTVLAVGSPYNNGFGSLEIYQYAFNSWSLGGKATAGETQRERFGTSVAISGDGKKVAAGAPFNSKSGTNAGKVRAFQFENVFTGWSIDLQRVNTKFDNSGKPELSLVYDYTQPAGSAASTYTMDIYRSTCNLGKANHDAVKPIPTTGTTSSAPTSTLQVNIDINTNTIVGSPYYTAPVAGSGNTAKIAFCAWVEVSNGGVMKAREKVDLTLDVDMNQDFTVKNVQTNRKPDIIVVREAAQFNYTINTFFCDDNYRKAPDQSITGGRPFQVCVQSPSGPGVQIVDLFSVSMENRDVPLLGVDLINAKGDPVNPATTSLTCANGICKLKTSAPASVYSYADASGNIIQVREGVYMQGSGNFGFARRFLNSLDERLLSSDTSSSMRFVLKIPIAAASEDVYSAHGLASSSVMVSKMWAMAMTLSFWVYLGW